MSPGRVRGPGRYQTSPASARVRGSWPSASRSSFARTLLVDGNLTLPLRSRPVKVHHTEMSKQSATGERRPYRKRRRAELEAETRLRITEAAVDLHGSVGPAR